MNYVISHSAKGSSWKDHKYIKKKNGRYYYKTTGGGEQIDKPYLDEDYMNSIKYKKGYDEDGNVVWKSTGEKVRKNASLMEYLKELLQGSVDQVKVNLGKDKTTSAIAELDKKKR